MLLTITTTYHPATDLGFLLHKHPERFQSVDLPAGRAHVFYPESGQHKTTVALLLDLDPIKLVKEMRWAGRGFALGQYVNDRPYVASSFVSVATAWSVTTSSTVAVWWWRTRACGKRGKDAARARITPIKTTRGT